MTPWFWFFKNYLEDISPFCGVTDTSVVDFWWPHLHVLLQIPQIHLCSDTCWLLSGQYGGWAGLIHVLTYKHLIGLKSRMNPWFNYYNPSVTSLGLTYLLLLPVLSITTCSSLSQQLCRIISTLTDRNLQHKQRNIKNRANSYWGKIQQNLFYWSNLRPFTF